MSYWALQRPSDLIARTFVLCRANNTVVIVLGRSLAEVDALVLDQMRQRYPGFTPERV